MKTKKKKFKLKFSICIPVYNGVNWIKPTLKSILSQGFDNFELILVDDCSKDNTVEAIREFKDARIKLFKNKKNLGYAGNLDECRKKARGEIIYLMGQDDILAKDALLNTYKAFLSSKNIGAVTRPYFWFEDKITAPVRAKDQLNPFKDEVVTINDDYERIMTMFKTLDQLSGLAYRKKYMDRGFHPDIFPCHVYPFVSIFKSHPIVFLKDYSVAVRMASSQTRTVSWIYDKSPVQSWVDLFESVYRGNKYKLFRKYAIKNFVATNYVGLVQIRNYARYWYLIREILWLLKYRPGNIISPAFWFFSLGCLIMPPKLLIPLVAWFKNRILSQKLAKIRFDYSLKVKK